MPFTIIRQDITRMQVDAVVNAANTQLAMGGGVCGAIFRAAGACQTASRLRQGGSHSDRRGCHHPGFDLPAKYVIHAAGPVYQQWNPAESARLLRSAYRSSLELAEKNHCASIAFPLISSGIYGYPKDQALQVAVSAIREFLADHDMDVYLVIFDRVSFAVGKELLGAVESYIDEHYVGHPSGIPPETRWKWNTRPWTAP